MPMSIARTTGLSSIVVAVVACFAVTSHAETKRNPDQHINFECPNCTVKTTVDHGYTNVYTECYGQLWSKGDAWSAACSSPDVDVVCDDWEQSKSMCECVSSAKHAHTVKVQTSDCSSP